MAKLVKLIVAVPLAEANLGQVSSKQRETDL
jgi:hypothetical protein